MKMTVTLEYPVVENRDGSDELLISGEREAMEKNGTGEYVGILADWTETHIDVKIEVINED